MTDLRPIFCAGVVSLLATAAAAQTAAPATSQPAPPPAAAPAAPTGPAPAPQPRMHKSGWPEIEVLAGLARCAVLLKGADVVVTPAEPMREGSECGAAAPIQLIAVGQNPQVVLSTPSVMTCDMALATAKWVREHVQPAARELLGSPVIRIDVMSAYSCRNAYGRTKTKLSEHGRANALDIRSFLLASGHTVDLLADWGPTKRDIIAAAAAAKAAAEKKAAEDAKAAIAKQPAAGPAIAEPTPAPPSSGPSLSIPGVTITLPSTAPPLPPVGLSPPSRLGGPKPKVAAAPVVPTADRKAKFLRRIHEGACKVYFTILGPEANEAHRNHFHVDMAERRSGHFCE